MERAAFLRGQNLTKFIVVVLAETSLQMIKDRELTDRDRYFSISPNCTLATLQIGKAFKLHS